MSQHRDLDVTKRDRFELLSAFLDGEVSPDERRLVMKWLADDQETQCLYRRLLSLRRGIQTMGCEELQVNACVNPADVVFTRLNRRFRLTCMAGMTAAAAAVVGVFSGGLNDTMSPSIGDAHPLPTGPGDSLEIALDHPPIAIPKPAVSSDIVPMGIPLHRSTAGEPVEQAL